MQQIGILTFFRDDKLYTHCGECILDTDNACTPLRLLHTVILVLYDLASY